MQTIIEAELSRRLGVFQQWRDDLLQEIKNCGPDWANPFSQELLLNVLQKESARLANTKPETGHCPTYASWLKRQQNTSHFVPVAFASTSVWRENDRERAIQHVAKNVNASITDYFSEISPLAVLEEDVDIRILLDDFCSEIRFFKNFGKRFRTYGSVLAIEPFIRRAEKRMQAVLPGVHALLGWNYPRSNFVLNRYVQGDTERDIERLFIRHWEKYARTLPPRIETN